MFAQALLLIAAMASTASGDEGNGYVGGIVVNAADGQPVAGAEVVLRRKLDDQFAPVAETTTDAKGKFLFQHLSTAGTIYLPGANWGGVHYPGPAIRLTPSNTTVGVKLKVCDAIGKPNPLVARRHEIVIRPEPGVLKVSETILIENPTKTCYVGEAPSEDQEAVTLCLHIPSDFEQVTFDKEFYGRRFLLAGGSLVTGIPWTPGQRELGFTYVLRNEQRHRTWQRALDLPCSDVSVRVATDKPEEVACSLAAGRSVKPGEVVFEYHGTPLPAGRQIRVDLGRLSIPLLVYGKWFAVGLLAVLVFLTAFAASRKRNKKSR